MYKVNMDKMCTLAHQRMVKSNCYLTHTVLQLGLTRGLANAWFVAPG